MQRMFFLDIREQINQTPFLNTIPAFESAA